MKEYQYNTVAEMYGQEDLGNDPIFPGDFINYGYWENTPGGAEDISVEDRIESSKNLYRQIFNRLDINTTDNVVEIGCGRGSSLALLRTEHEPRNIYGVDFSPFQAQRSHRKISNLPGNNYVINATAENLPFASDSISKAYSLEAIQHFKFPDEFIHELGRITTADGSVVISSFFASNEQAKEPLADRLPTVKRGIDKALAIDDIVGWLHDANFSEVTVEPIGELVWAPFVKWCEQVKPEEVSSNWLEAYEGGLLDYYIVTAKK